MKLNSPFVITINRQLGSGGEYIGQQLAKRLNFFYFDREIISETAKQLSILEKDLESRDEKVSSFWQSYFNSYSFINPDTYIPPQNILPTDGVVFRAESGIIERIAGERSSVIIGRCSSYILRDHPNHVSIFVHADNTFRNNRIQSLKLVSKEAADNMIKESDKERSHYYHAFTGKEWTEACQYDITLDSGRIGLDRCIDIILKYLDFV